MGSIGRSALCAGAVALILCGVIGSAGAQGCSRTIRVLAQPRDGLTLDENYQSEFATLSGGASFRIDYLNENDRRSKSKADAALVGHYDVYYVDEANLALFASSGWIVPLSAYYPPAYDYDDFDPGRREVATYRGKVWFAPVTGGGDMLIYRKDLLAKAGVAPPTTLDAFVAAVSKLNDPADELYGTALRGQRGSGENVWRWMPYFKGLGGRWFDGATPVFDSEAAVRATQLYLDLFRSSAPGTRTGGWDEATGAFLSGHVALMIESTPLTGQALDPQLSKVVGKVGYLPPPTPLPGDGFAQGLAIGSKANPTEHDRQCAGLFIAWATSKQNEQRRLAAGAFGELNRTSVLTSPQFVERYGADLSAALAATAKVTAVNYWQDPRWPELGDRWGIILEELITGTRSDVKGALDELNGFAKQLVAKRD